MEQTDKRTSCDCPNCWNFYKQPRNKDNIIYHIFEALADSAMQFLVNDNLDGVQDRLRRLLGLAKRMILEAPITNIYRCRHRENKRTRCNLPLDENFHCQYHGDQISQSLDDFLISHEDFADSGG